jgi:hypothetical protein
MSTHFLSHYTAAEFILYSSINSTQSPASGSGNVKEPRLESQVGRVRVDQCVSAVMAGEVPVLVCLRSSYCHVIKLGGAHGLCYSR